ncbi:hypothetical protein [Yersinia enterocolitica]|uniref:hypothetical protein n=1 Tax=Yersinia enterocolitica TaxID=630 RepID=UPI001F588C32|nr:hypothetical protein [Yersinia enterocolitica]
MPVKRGLLLSIITSGGLFKVTFANNGKDEKVGYIKKHIISMYYGDSDSDILDARKANVEGIIMMCPLNSMKLLYPVNGSFIEKVIINSQY